MAWRASGDPQAVLVVLHGFGLHKEAFEAFAERMIKQNITVFGLDARGFGCWNQTGKTSKLDFAASLNDVDNLVQHIHRQHPGKPVFVLGESMGGATALAYAAAHRHTINGVVLSVPAYKRVAAARTTIEVAANFLWHRGRRVQLEQVMVNRASHDQALKGTWENDPKARLSVSLTDLIHFSSFMKQCRQNASLIDDLPVLFVQGEADKLIKPSGTEELFKRMPNRRSSWH
jgi:alpha-beta hydrolase superfamily lysophospholipase